MINKIEFSDMSYVWGHIYRKYKDILSKLYYVSKKFSVVCVNIYNCTTKFIQEYENKNRFVTNLSIILMKNVSFS